MSRSLNQSGTLQKVADAATLAATYQPSATLDTTNAANINTPASATATALNATYANRSGLSFSQYGYQQVPVSASPPTVTVTNDTTVTTMTNVVTLPGVSYTSIMPNDYKKFTALGAGEIPATIGGSGSLSGFQAGWIPGSAGSNRTQAVTLDFLFDGVEFELGLHQASTSYRLRVDGQYLTKYPQTLGGTQNAYGNVKVTFPAAAVRHISVELYASSQVWTGLWMHKTDTMLPTSKPARRLVIVGDSYGGGAYSSAIGTFVNYLGQGLGFTDTVNGCVGSTGWLANGTSTNLATRLQTDVIDQKPTDVIITLGYNDTAFTPTQITAQVTGVLASIRAGLPKLRTLTVTGPLFPGNKITLYTPIHGAIKAGSAAADVFVDTLGVPIFTGTGNTGALQNDGNGDLYIGPDATHPTDPGSLWLGYTLAQRIAAAFQ